MPDQGAPGGDPWLFRFGAQAIANLANTSMSAALNGDNVIIAGTASQTIRVYKMFSVIGGAATVTIKSGTAGGLDLTGAMSITANGSIVLDFDGEPWFVTVAGDAFTWNQNAAIQTSGRVYYTRS